MTHIIGKWFPNYFWHFRLTACPFFLTLPSPGVQGMRSLLSILNPGPCTAQGPTHMS